MKKIIFTLLLSLSLSATLSAQSDKLKAKATEKVEELNTEIVAGDKSQALSEDQKAQIFDIHVERIKATKKARKDGAEKEEIKAINKKYFQKIFKEVLTNKQLKARRAGKKSDD